MPEPSSVNEVKLKSMGVYYHIKCPDKIYTSILQF